MIRIALLCAASCTLCNHRTENDFIGIASIGLVLSKIAVTVAFFFEGGAGGPYKPDGKALSPAYVDDLFQTLTGFGLRKHSCEYRNLRRASESCARARDCGRGMSSPQAPPALSLHSLSLAAVITNILPNLLTASLR